MYTGGVTAHLAATQILISFMQAIQIINIKSDNKILIRDKNSHGHIYQANRRNINRNIN